MQLSAVNDLGTKTKFIQSGVSFIPSIDRKNYGVLWFNLRVAYSEPVK